MIPQIFIPTAELVIPTGTQTNEVNAETKTQLVIVEAKINKHNLISNYNFAYLNIHHVSFLLKNNFLFHLFF